MLFAESDPEYFTTITDPPNGWQSDASGGWDNPDAWWGIFDTLKHRCTFLAWAVGIGTAEFGLRHFRNILANIVLLARTPEAGERFVCCRDQIRDKEHHVPHNLGNNAAVYLSPDPGTPNLNCSGYDSDLAFLPSQSDDEDLPPRDSRYYPSVGAPASTTVSSSSVEGKHAFVCL